MMVIIIIIILFGIQVCCSSDTFQNIDFIHIQYDIYYRHTHSTNRNDKKKNGGIELLWVGRTAIDGRWITFLMLSFRIKCFKIWYLCPSSVDRHLPDSSEFVLLATTNCVIVILLSFVKTT